MLIESVSVRNFRSILDETFSIDALTALVGRNGSGKSTFLKALDLFYKASPKVEPEDFCALDTSAEIVVSVTFIGLSADAKTQFSHYMQGDRLTVERVVKWDNGKVVCTYHGASQQHAAFSKVREGLSIKDRGKTAKTEYDALKLLPEYQSLPVWTSISGVEPALKQWESENLDKCTPQRDDGRFFGFTEVGQGYLGKYTRFLFVPAVRDASSDAAEARGSVLTDLMDMVVRSVLSRKENLLRLQEETQQKFQEVMKPENLPELQSLSESLSTTLKNYVPNASIDLRWLPLNPVRMEMPKADVKLVEDDFATSVDRTGHGLQRAYILTMLQHLAVAKSNNDVKTTGAFGVPNGPPAPEQKILLPNLVLAVEEPELYQHPNRQRHMAKIFLNLASGATPGVAEKTQIIYATHSPLFVGLDRFDQIRILRKVQVVEGKPKITRVIQTTIEKVAEKLWEADGRQGEKYTGTSLIPRLHAIMTPWTNEGFFADSVVLVEGDDDYAALLGMSIAMGVNLESAGISIVPAGGKRNIDRPAHIFREFGIPVYLLWDADGGQGETSGVCGTCGRHLDGKPDPRDNHRLLRFSGTQEEDWPEHLHPTYCCFKRNLESTIRNEIGAEVFDRILSECQTEYAIGRRKHAIKNPVVLAEIIRRAKKEGCTCKTLEAVIENICKLSKSPLETRAQV